MDFHFQKAEELCLQEVAISLLLKLISEIFAHFEPQKTYEKVNLAKGLTSGKANAKFLNHNIEMLVSRFL